MNEQPTVETKADVKPIESCSIRALKVDVAICKVLHSSKGPVRMKSLCSAESLKLLSETTVRKHLRSLEVRGVVTQDPVYRGTYTLDQGRYYMFEKDLARYLERILGSDMMHAIVDSLRH